MLSTRKLGCHLVIAILALMLPLQSQQSDRNSPKSSSAGSLPGHCSAQAPPEFAAWVRSNAIPIATTEPGSNFDDLRPFEEIVGKAHVVGLGESMHTAHEFYQMRHRLLQFLIERMGFTAFAMETGFVEAVKVNDYVLGRVNEPPRWQHTWFTWDFGYEEELQALVRWTRAYNADPRHTRKVHFYGIDAPVDYSSPVTAVAAAQAYLDSVDPAYAASRERQNLLTLARKFDGSGFSWEALGISVSKYQKLPLEERNAYTAAISDLLARFRANRIDYIRRSTLQDYEWAYHCGVVAQQLDTAYRGAAAASHPSCDRDCAMAENVIWALEREGPAGRIVVWAHNSHLMKSNFKDGSPSLGLYLNSIVGHDYVSVGFTHYQYRGENPWWAQTSKEINLNVPAGCGTLDGELGRLGLHDFIVSLDSAPDEGPVHNWLSAPRIIGGMQVQRTIGTFDAVLFIREITAARGHYTPQ